MATGQTCDAGILLRRIEGGPSVEAACCAIADSPSPFLLDRAAEGRTGGRFSILGFDPIDVFQHEATSDGDWLAELTERVGPSRARFREANLPIAAGWVGYVSYEAAASLQSVPTTKPRESLPSRVRFALYDTVGVFDHHENVWTVIAVDPPGYAPRTTKSDRVDRLISLLRNAPLPPPIDWSRAVASAPSARMSRGDYFDRVARAKRYIEAGDIYQVNVTQQLTSETHAPAMDIYRRLRAANPGAYSALLMCGESAVLSSSPELFLELRDGVITTRPIKGTTPRTGDAVSDEVRRRELVKSAKDQAELAMIVDLLRNDLGRVSEFGSVRVNRAADLETHPTVFHLAATITGRLRGDLNWSDTLRACLPGGSITGCPKIRAMQIIDELETTERGVYCGSIGYIGLDGSMCMNIAIRTMVLSEQRLRLYGGGAIVADSDAQAEYEETFAKTAGMVRALGVRDSGAAWERSA